MVNILRCRQSTLNSFSKLSLLAVTFFTVIFTSSVSAQALFAYKGTSGTITFTSRKPSDKNYWLVNPKTPKFSIIVHRGLGYSWSPYPKPSKYDDLIRELAKKHKVEAALVKAVMHVESAFNTHAKSSAGAQGLMQLMPATARRFGVSDSHHPIDNMSGGIKYLRWLYERFEGNLRFVLAGYNAGEGAVDRYKGIPPYTETQDYVRKVLKMAELYRCDFSGENKSCKAAQLVNKNPEDVKLSARAMPKG